MKQILNKDGDQNQDKNNRGNSPCRGCFECCFRARRCRLFFTYHVPFFFSLFFFFLCLKHLNYVIICGNNRRNISKVKTTQGSGLANTWYCFFLTESITCTERHDRVEKKLNQITNSKHTTNILNFLTIWWLVKILWGFGCLCWTFWDFCPLVHAGFFYTNNLKILIIVGGKIICQNDIFAIVLIGIVWSTSSTTHFSPNHNTIISA